MGIVVQKYGGSSLGTNARVRRVAAKVAERHREGDQVVVVVSARGETTDNLMDMATSLGGDPPQREMDVLLSAGEQISRSLLALAIDSLGREVISLSGPQAGILTDDQHLKAEILRVKPERILEELEQGRIVVVAGFQGQGPHGEMTTLGRGGSDTTAVALAAALEADRCEIYSDVAGVWSTDPRKVPDARPVPHIAYGEMYELARQGAGVLHYRAVSLAEETGVEIAARSTFDGNAETRICSSGPSSVAGVAYRPRVLWVRGESRTLSLGQELFSPVPPEELVTIEAAAGSGRPASDVLVPLENVPEEEAFVTRIEQGLGDAVELRDDCGTVTAVGRDLHTSTKVGALHRHLRAQGLVVHQELNSRNSHTWVLPRLQIEDALRQVHRWLLKEPSWELAG